MAGEVLPAGSTNTQGLAPWAAPYITDYLGKAKALADTPYQAYKGPLTAGASNLQNQAFQGIGSLTVPDSIGQAAGMAGNIAGQAQNMGATTFGQAQAQQYMNPYLQSSLNPQLEEARRQSDITAQQNNAAMTKAGAFGGGRQAILTSENQRNLGSNLANITGQGYNTAYNNAMSQFNADQNRGLAGLNTALSAAQAQGNLGSLQNQTNLANVSAQLTAGGQERAISSEDIAARQAEFNQQRQYPFQQVQFQRDMIAGLPTGQVANNAASLTGMGAFLSSLGGGAAAAGALGYKNVGDLLRGLGLNLEQP